MDTDSVLVAIELKFAPHYCDVVSRIRYVIVKSEEHATRLAAGEEFARVTKVAVILTPMNHNCVGEKKGRNREIVV